MESSSVEIRPTIDRSWLEEAARVDPIAHAYATWDLARAPDRVRFISALDGGRTVGYLLVWLGDPAAVVVHWVGTGAATRALAGALPPRPFTGVIPPSARVWVEEARGPIVEREIRLLERPRGSGPIAPELPSGVRRLGRDDRATIASWAEQQHDPLVAEYPSLDPDADPAWAAFDHGRPVGVARAGVRLPSVWIVGGVYVEPAARGVGWGRKLMMAAIGAAEAAGARAALYVRADRAPALRLYGALGFRPIDRRLWIDAGTGRAP